MGIMDMFRQAAAPAQQQQAPANGPGNPGNIPPTQATSAALPGTGTVPNPAASAPANPDKTVSPLDAFTDLWKTDPNAKPSQSSPTFNVDQKALMDAAAQNDFTKLLTPEQLAKINAGGTEAMGTVLSAMNKMVQASYGQSAFATTKIVEQALQKQAEMFKAQLPSLIKGQNVSELLRNDNPIFKHPAAEPMLKSLQESIAVKFPNASASEHADMAKEYLSSFAEMAAGKQKEAAGSGSGGAKGATDWSAFLE